MAAGGREVGAAIVRHQTLFEPGNPSNLCDRSPFLVAYINGTEVPVEDVWTRRGRPISEKEYEFLIRDVDWARQHAPASSLAKPQERVDLRTVPVPTIRK